MLLTAALTLLGRSGLTLTRAYLYQTYEGQAFDLMLHKPQVRSLPSASEAPQLALDSHSAPAIYREAVGRKPIARIEIPRVGLDTLVLEGDDAKTLELGAGHIPGTALPGTGGNAVIAGHRDTFFRRLRSIEKDDRVSVRTPGGTYEYQIETIEVVDPGELSVLGPTADNTLTLVTCYPFSFVGAAPKRFVVRARQVPVSRRFAVGHDHKIETG